MKTVRCAIYTRKSSEEGLQQDFNSLDAQREACAAYILSQASEGWSALPDIYDDGGLSGGTLERPALRRLLADVAAGNVDIIVVYKVDRLTRSLLDFSKLVEKFDAADTSFVSVTQSFNTTTSMGRLTLNMLLSFAQFEREVTAERIRDKIAASKAKGMWMGGTPPLGYAPDGRSLKIIEEHAAVVRKIYERYLETGNVRHLSQQLAVANIIMPQRMTLTGRQFGGTPFSRGNLYSILKCPTYVGDVVHREQTYDGLHPPIVDRSTWNAVQATLADNVRGERSGARAANPGLLAGKVVDSEDKPLVSTHACKAKVRYRYYVSHALQTAEATTGQRVPARELEALVTATLAHEFDDPLALAAKAGLAIDVCGIESLSARGVSIGGRIRGNDRELVRSLVEQVRLNRSDIEIVCSTSAIASILNTPRSADAPEALMIRTDARLTRTGRAIRLIRSDASVVTATPDASLIKLVIKARGWWAMLRNGDIDIKRLAAREGVAPSYMTRVVRLAFLSPAVVDAILAGALRAGADSRALTATDGVPADWSEQRRMMLPR